MSKPNRPDPHRSSSGGQSPLVNLAQQRRGSNGRSAELVGFAQPIVRCGEIGRVSGRGEVAERRVRPAAIEVDRPAGDRRFGVGEREEQGLVEKLVAHAPLKLSTKPFWVGLPGSM